MFLLYLHSWHSHLNILAGVLEQEEEDSPGGGERDRAEEAADPRAGQEALRGARLRLRPQVQGPIV